MESPATFKAAERRTLHAVRLQRMVVLTRVPLLAHLPHVLLQLACSGA